MGRSMQWLSLAGGLIILVYGLLRLFGPQQEWTPAILGVLIVAFSISKMTKSKAGKEKSGGNRS